MNRSNFLSYRECPRAHGLIKDWFVDHERRGLIHLKDAEGALLCLTEEAYREYQERVNHD